MNYNPCGVYNHMTLYSCTVKCFIFAGSNFRGFQNWTLIHGVLNSLSDNVCVLWGNVDGMCNIIYQYFAGGWIRVPSANREYSENKTPAN